MKLRMHFEQHLHSGMNSLSGHPFEMWLDQHPSVSPTGSMSLSYRRIGLFILLDEFHIAVPSVSLTGLRKFSFYPITVGQ